MPKPELHRVPLRLQNVLSPEKDPARVDGDPVGGLQDGLWHLCEIPGVPISMALRMRRTPIPQYVSELVKLRSGEARGLAGVQLRGAVGASRAQRMTTGLNGLCETIPKFFSDDTDGASLVSRDLAAANSYAVARGVGGHRDGRPLKPPRSGPERERRLHPEQLAGHARPKLPLISRPPVDEGVRGG